MALTRRAFLGLVGSAGAAGMVSAESSTPPPAPALPVIPGPVPKRKFGRHNEQVSVLGLGGQTLAQASSLEEAKRIARHAIERGMTFFDNAWDYHGGKAEEWMGEAMTEGWRDKVFLMTKVCTHGHPLPRGGKEGAMQMLEDSLRRLKTDRIDLWMIHQLENDAEVDKAYGPGGVIEALELAKKQGKIRYAGFTGHTRPESHLKILEGGYKFDASLMPVSALGAVRVKQGDSDILHSCRFVSEVMPALEKHQVACIGMKGFGGSRRAHLAGLVNASKVVRFALSYPQVCTHLVGIDKFEFVDQAVVASHETPMAEPERKAFMASCAFNDASKYAAYLEDGHRDGVLVRS
jgi:aryl-alcohol dehydrogenase-like predicted oxidoreductase